MFLIGPGGKRGWLRKFIYVMGQRWKLRHVVYRSPWRRRLLWWMSAGVTLKGKRVQFPLFEVATCSTIKLSEIKQRRFGLIERRPFGCVEVKEEEFICHVSEQTLGV